jgi:hypothetical protein
MNKTDNEWFSPQNQALPLQIRIDQELLGAPLLQSKRDAFISRAPESDTIISQASPK